MGTGMVPFGLAGPFRPLAHRAPCWLCQPAARWRPNPGGLRALLCLALASHSWGRLPAGNRDPGLALRCSHPSADRLSPGRATVALPPVSSYVAIIYYGSQGDLRTVEMLIRALPCVRAAPNSQGWGPQDPKRPCAPHVALLVSSPLSCFCRRCHVREPLPWRTGLQQGCCPAAGVRVNADTLPCVVPCAAAAWPPRALVIASRDIRAPWLLLRACWASALSSMHFRC